LEEFDDQRCDLRRIEMTERVTIVVATQKMSDLTILKDG